MSGEDNQGSLSSPGDSYPGIPINDESDSGTPVNGEFEKFPSTKKPLRDRLTVVSHVYHQRAGKDPKSIESKFCRDLESKGQLYEREMEATEEWQPLDCGWVTDVGMMVVLNQEGQNLQVHPTDEEREATAKKVLELAYDFHDGTGPCGLHSWLIPPGESFQGFPSQAASLYIRSQSGVAEYTLYLIPR